MGPDAKPAEREAVAKTFCAGAMARGLRTRDQATTSVKTYIRVKTFRDDRVPVVV